MQAKLKALTRANEALSQDLDRTPPISTRTPGHVQEGAAGSEHLKAFWHGPCTLHHVIMGSPSPDPKTRSRGAARILWTWSGIARLAMLGILLLLAWRGREVFLLLFAGVLLSLLLSAFTDLVSLHTPLKRKAAFPLVLLLLTSVVTGAVWLAAPSVGRQVDELTESLPRAVERLTERVEEYRWARELLERAPAPEEIVSSDSEAIARTTTFLSSTAGAIAAFVIVLFIGLYLAAQPDLYARGLLHLVPPERRPRGREVLEEAGSTLQRWLLAQLVSMGIVGLLTTLGLWLLGVPLALTLGILAALSEFIPNFGPILSAVPAVLLALVDSPRLALWVVVLYAGIQAAESYPITPLVQQRLASLPPVLVIVSQLLGGILFGFLGFALATPLLAVAIVLVKRLYVEDRLGETLEEPSADQRELRTEAI